jgi:hypothetical protein
MKFLPVFEREDLILSHVEIALHPLEKLDDTGSVALMRKEMSRLFQWQKCKKCKKFN